MTPSDFSVPSISQRCGNRQEALGTSCFSRPSKEMSPARVPNHLIPFKAQFSFLSFADRDLEGRRAMGRSGHLQEMCFGNKVFSPCLFACSWCAVAWSFFLHCPTLQKSHIGVCQPPSFRLQLWELLFLVSDLIRESHELTEA